MVYSAYLVFCLYLEYPLEFVLDIYCTLCSHHFHGYLELGQPVSVLFLCCKAPIQIHFPTFPTLFGVYYQLITQVSELLRVHTSSILTTVYAKQNIHRI